MRGPMPATRRAAGAGLVADMNVRAAAGGGAPGLDRAALTFSAGAPATGEPSVLPAYSAFEVEGGGPAQDLYRSIYGASPGNAQVLYLGLPRQRLVNERTSLANRIGALGQAVRDAGGVTAAVGSSDPGIELAREARQRPAALMASDGSGLVDLGDVSPGMLQRDFAAPFGVRTNISALRAAYAAVVKAIPAGKPALTVVDTGDLARAYQWSSLAETRAAEPQKRSALTVTDQIVQMAALSLDPERDLLVVMAPLVPEIEGEPAAFAPLIMRGGVGKGIGRAASTHRDGICTLMDVSVTVADALGIAAPADMVGSRVTGDGSSAALDVLVAHLSSLSDVAVAVESVRIPSVNWFITLTALVLIAATFLVYRGVADVPRPLRSFVRVLLILMQCVPLAALLEFVIWRHPRSGVAVLSALVAVTAVLLAGALMAGRGRPATIPLIVVTGLTTAVLLVDQWLGAPLSFAGLFGYSPLFGARYYGIGNEMAGLLLGSAMVLGSLALDTWRDAPWAFGFRRWGWPLLGLVVVMTTAAPFLGANVGAIAWMTVGFAAGWLMLNGMRVWTWRNVAVVALIVGLLVAGMVVADLAGNSATETHLGRAVSTTVTGGAAGLWSIVVRKAETNIRVLGRTNWTWLLVVVLVLLGYMRWRPRGEFAAMLREHPSFAAVVGAALFAGLVGYFTEDSGIIIPALIMLPVGVASLYLMPSHGGAVESDAE